MNPLQPALLLHCSAMCYVPFNKHVLSGLLISVFLVSAGQQMPSWLEVEAAHSDVTPPTLQGAWQSQRSIHQVCFSLTILECFCFPKYIYIEFTLLFFTSWIYLADILYTVRGLKKNNQVDDDCAALQESSVIKWHSAWGLLHQYDCIWDNVSITLANTSAGVLKLYEHTLCSSYRILCDSIYLLEEYTEEKWIWLWRYFLCLLLTATK